MGRTDLAARAHLVILPMGIGHARPSSLRHDGTVLDAVRHVMEVLAPEERQRAVVQTTTRLLFFPEIEAIFETMVLREEHSPSAACIGPA